MRLSPYIALVLTSGCVAEGSKLDMRALVDGLTKPVVIYFAEGVGRPEIIVSERPEEVFELHRPAGWVNGTDAIHLFVFERDTYRQADGSPIAAGDASSGPDDMVWKNVHARLFLENDPSATTGRCRTCLAQNDKAPQVAHPGDSCAPPAWAEYAQVVGGKLLTAVELGEADLLQARGQLRIDWPGACSDCTTPLESDYGEGTPVDVEVIRGGWHGDTWPIPDSNNDGRTFPADEKEWPIVDDRWPFYHSACLEGSPQVCAFVSERRGLLRVDNVYDKVLESTGPRPVFTYFESDIVEGVRALRPGIFMVSVHDRLGRFSNRPRRYVLFNKDFELITEVSAPTPIVRPDRVIYFPDTGDRVFIVGWAEPHGISPPEPDIVGCDVTDGGGAMTCFSITTAETRSKLRDTPNVRRLSSDTRTGTSATYLWWGGTGMTFARPAVGAQPWQWRLPSLTTREYGFAPHASRPGRMEDTSLSGAFQRVGDRLYMCGTGKVSSSTISAAFVMSATISEDLYGFEKTKGEPRVGWSISAFSADRYCAGLGLSDDQTQVIAAFSDDVRVTLDAEGKVVGTQKTLRASRGVDESYTAAWWKDGHYYALSKRDGFKENNTQVKICPNTNQMCGRDLLHPCGCAIVTQIVKSESGGVTRHRASRDNDFGILGSDECDTITDAALDARGEVIVTGYNRQLCREFPSPEPKRTGWIRRLVGYEYDPSAPTARPSPRFEEIEIPANLQLDEGLGYTHVAAIAPGHFIILGQSLDAFRLRDGVLTKIEIDFKDAATGQSVDPNGRCSSRRSGDEDELVWRSLAAGDGYAFAAGCEGVVVRIDSVGAQWFGTGRGEWSTTRPAYSADFDVYGVEAMCPNVALLLTHRGTAEQMWSLAPMEGADAARDGPTYTDYAQLTQDAPRNYTQPVELVGVPQTPTQKGSLLVLSRGPEGETWVHALGTKDHLRVPNDNLRAIAEGGDGSVFLGFDGRWIAIVKPR